MGFMTVNTDDVALLDKVASRLMRQETARLEILQEELWKAVGGLDQTHLSPIHLASIREEVSCLRHEVMMLKSNERLFRCLTPLARVGVLAAFGTQDGGLPRVGKSMIRHLTELVDDFLFEEQENLSQTVRAAKFELEHLLGCNPCWARCQTSCGENHEKLNTDDSLAELCVNR
jgi:hypothetical protein